MKIFINKGGEFLVENIYKQQFVYTFYLSCLLAVNTICYLLYL